MKRDECWMTFSEALEQYLNAREDQHNDCPVGCTRWQANQQAMSDAAAHMDALTDGPYRG